MRIDDAPANEPEPGETTDWRAWRCPWCGFLNTRADCIFCCERCETFR